MIDKPLKEHLQEKSDEIERRLLCKALGKTKGNVTHAAPLLNTTRRDMSRRIARLEIPLHLFRGEG